MENQNNILLLEQAIEPNFKKSFWALISRWHSENGFRYPWREAPTPYSILVSELMLQQTQAETVIPYFLAWMERFPNWRSLAEAPEKEVLRAWEGLGYYSRARNLHKIAQWVYFEKKGELPSEPKELLKLPGIGPYTANAVASLAFGRKVPALDGNVIRVIARLMAIDQPVHRRETIRKIFTLATSLMPEDIEASYYNSALMDFGRAICRPKHPKCKLCVLKEICKAKQPGLLAIRPKVTIEEKEEKIAIIREKNRFWMQQESFGKKRYCGLWVFPLFDPEFMEQKAMLFSLRYSFTRYRIFLEAYEASWNKRGLKTQPLKGEWVEEKNVLSLPLPAPHRKIWLQLVAKKPSDRQ